MRALRFHEYGGLDALKFDTEVPIPNPGPGEIQIRVSGSGINPVDLKILSGSLKAYFPVDLPAIVSREFSGVVSELGEGVVDFQVGDEVYGIAPKGSCAEYTVASADATGLKPVAMDLADAAAVPLTGMTAWQALFDVANLQTGQKVLIHAAAGGVGSFAVQFAKWKGAYVYGTASKRNHHLLEELGVDSVIDYNETRFEDVAKDVDVVLETVGGDQMLRSLSCLKTGGILVSITSQEPTEEAKAEGKRAEHLMMKPTRRNLEEIAALIQDLKVVPVVDTVVKYDEAIEGFKESLSGHVRGKLVVRIA